MPRSIVESAASEREVVRVSTIESLRRDYRRSLLSETILLSLILITSQLVVSFRIRAEQPWLSLALLWIATCICIRFSGPLALSWGVSRDLKQANADLASISALLIGICGVFALVYGIFYSAQPMLGLVVFCLCWSITTLLGKFNNAHAKLNE